MVNTRRSSITPADDSNNNAENYIIIDASQVENGQKCYIGDIVWIKHNHTLDTPVIVQNILNGDIAEVQNLIDETVISINGKYLSKTRSTLVETRQKCKLSSIGTLALIRQYNCRQSIEELMNAIECTNSRQKFVSQELKHILDEGTNRNYDGLLKRIKESKNKKNVILAMYNLYYQLQYDSFKMSIDEMQSIAMKIQLTIPDCIRVCDHCLEPGELLLCGGSCEKTFHRKCMKKHERNIDWTRIEQQTKTNHHSSIKNGTATQVCRSPQCRLLNNNPVDMNNNCTNLTTCDTPFREDRIECVECQAVYNSTNIPIGALLLSKSQLVCGTHRKIIEKKMSVCTFCLKWSRNLVKCTKCANAFHKNCNGDKSECQQCATSNRYGDIVYTYTSNKWWPAIIIRDEQLTKKQRKITITKRDWGTTMVFVIGKNIYKQVHVKNLLRFSINKIIRDETLATNEKLNNAVQIATAIYQLNIQQP
ncbi:uncharacterized protein LOC116352512 [Contarinia nasturtii]|uniref:uncharacterized protein LOC116352512 n=1 Tax=Contarinia nasturtii TaxID=265458 RepID=UPI0012D4163F|nr:uncharacterized protein LOC116352512 [Contarinia nasturtii]